jgi:catechol 2,3-dioxygenase-like lactoylglutathione lyase family enzyme
VASVPADATSAGPITGLVAMIPVTDVERSVAFYRLLGFEVGNRVPPSGPMGWCWLYSPQAADWKRGPNLMLTLSCSNDPVVIQEPAVLFYFYATDLVALREKLLASGLAAGEICYPEYLPKGEFRLMDPDGYTLMIAQAAGDTP